MKGIKIEIVPMKLKHRRRLHRISVKASKENFYQKNAEKLNAYSFEKTRTTFATYNRETAI